MTAVQIIQIDRDAAASMGGYPHQEIMRNGQYDNHPYIQAFARHRQAAEKATREECAKVADDYAAQAWGMTEEGHAAEQIATAIRSQNDG